MAKALLVFPHQLFDPNPGWEHQPDWVVLLEDSLFFGDWRYPAQFHVQKLWLHRASMARYAESQRRSGRQVLEIRYEPIADLLLRQLSQLPSSIDQWIVVDPVDDILRKRLERASIRLDKRLTWLASPNFLNTAAENRAYRGSRSRWFQTDFYKHQRQRLGILIERGEPVGGQWTFDTDNRLKIPRRMLTQIPSVSLPEVGAVEQQARASVLRDFSQNPGRLGQLYYPTTHRAAAAWLEQFVAERLALFGPYEDAMVAGQIWLWHSGLTPALNIGLLTPRQVLDCVLSAAAARDLPIASVEGFVRQVIGWREFIRATYEDLGATMRTSNHWDHQRDLPPGFYTATTGIEPIDDTLRRVLETGYCHHIERLMVLGGFLFLCEVEPTKIYRWFMEMFVDSYDWVMVPNVYAMSQHADGGLITTKPYFSGSAYIRKMSHYSPGRWSELWDALYWRWIGNHSLQLAQNPRWSMMCRQWSKMSETKQSGYLRLAEEYLSGF